VYAINLCEEVHQAVLVDGITIRAAATRFKQDRKTARKFLLHAAPPGYQRRSTPSRPRLDPVRAALDRMIAEDAGRPPGALRPARRLMEELQAGHGYAGGLTIIKDYLRPARRRPTGV